MELQWNEINDGFLNSLLNENIDAALKIAEETLEKGVAPQQFFELLNTSVGEK